MPPSTIVTRRDVDDATIRREVAEIRAARGRPPLPPAVPVGPPQYPPALPPDGRLRVGIACACCGLGGADLWVADLLERTDPARIRWEGCAIRDDTGVPVHRPFADRWERVAPLRAGDAAIRELAQRCDLLVAWGMGHSWGITAERFGHVLGKTPILQVSHGADSATLAADLGGLVIAGSAVVSPCAVRGLVAGYREPAPPVVHNLVAPERVAPTRPVAETRAMLGIPPGVKVAGWLARMSDEKRYDVFIRACALLPDGWIGVMAGTGWRDDVVGRMVADEAPGKVILAGPRDDVGDVLAAYDCLCMPSRTEAASLSAMEAWLGGVPLISTAVGMLEDHPGLARIIDSPPTAEGLAAAILADDADEDGTAERVKRARAFAGENLSAEAFGAKWTELICKVGPVPTAAPRPTPGDPRRWAVANPTAAQQDARLAVLRGQCPHAQKEAGCGCDGRVTCRLGRGTDGRPNVQECFTCLRASRDVDRASGSPAAPPTRPCGPAPTAGP